MNKESYIRDRESYRVDLEGAYEMYMTKNPERPKVDFNQFIALFTSWIRYNSVYLDNYFEYWDEKYEIAKTEKAEE